MPLVLEPIEDGESGLSVRTKLNRLILGATNGQLGVVTPEDLETIVDKVAPATPTGLELHSTAIPPLLTATWTFNDEEDFAHYDLHIREGEGNWIGIQTSAEAYKFTPRSNVEYSARIRAVDRSGNASAFSAVVTHLSAKDDVPPATPAGLKATGGFNVIWLKWAHNSDPDISYYEVFQATSASGAPAAGSVATYRTPGNQLVIENLTDKTRRWFWLRAVDTSGNTSAWTASVNATTAGLTSVDIEAIVDATSFARGAISIPELSIVDILGDTVFGADGKISPVAYISMDGNNVLLSDVAANSLTPSINFVGTFETAPTQAQLGAAWKQNAVYKNATDGKSYVLTGSPLGWAVYLEDGKLFQVVIESTNGTVFRVGQSRSTMLKAHLFKNGAEVTDQTPESWFRWRRVSMATPNDDATWNGQYSTGYKQININVDAVNSRATFFVDIISS